MTAKMTFWLRAEQRLMDLLVRFLMRLPFLYVYHYVIRFARNDADAVHVVERSYVVMHNASWDHNACCEERQDVYAVHDFRRKRLLCACPPEERSCWTRICYTTCALGTFS